MTSLSLVVCLSVALLPPLIRPIVDEQEPPPTAAPTHAPAGIYRTAADFRRHVPAVRGRRAGLSFSGRYVVVTQQTAAGKVEQRMPVDSLWGYADREGYDHRYFEGRAYAVEQADSVVLYSRRLYLSLPTGPRFVKQYFFSVGAQAPVLRLERAKLKAAYRALNPRLLALLDQQKWYQSLTDFDRRTRTYRLVALHRQALGQP